MNPERLLQNFDRLIDTPDAVLRLRRFILDLAVRGKLVEQNPEDEKVADSFLREPESNDLPQNWRLLNFGKFCDIQGGNQPPKSQFIDEPRSGYVRLFQIRDLGESPVPTYIPEGTINRFCREGEILIGRYGASIGKVFWAQNGAYNVALAKFIFPEKAFVSQFAFLVLKSSFFQTKLIGATRSAQAGFNKGDLAEIDFPLPPLAEQHRIVAKVDELMKLCDELETAQAKRERRRDRLVAATLHGLNNGNSDSETIKQLPFKDSARFYFNHLPRLTTRPEHIQQLRQTILNLAVRGKLVPQDPKDEPAGELLKRIEEEKKRLFKAGEIRKEKPLPQIDVETPLYDLPGAWKWTSIRQITSDRGQKIPTNKFSYIDVSSIDKERGEIGQSQILTPDTAPSRARKIVQKGDVIYSCVRPYLLNIAVVNEEFKPEPIVSTAFAVLNGLGLVQPRYLWIVLRSPYFVACVEVKMRGQAYPAVNDGDFAPLPVPLPPLAEQHRIVAKVNELMALCNAMESRITTNTTTSRQLLVATLQEVLAGVN